MDAMQTAQIIADNLKNRQTLIDFITYKKNLLACKELRIYAPNAGTELIVKIESNYFPLLIDVINQSIADAEKELAEID